MSEAPAPSSRSFPGSGRPVSAARIGTRPPTVRLVLASLLALLLIGISVHPLAAQTDGATEIEVLRTLAPDARVDLGVVTHDLDVRVWDRDEIEVRGSYDEGRETFTLEETDGRFQLRIEQRRRVGNFRPGARTLEVRVPAGVHLRAATVSGSLRAGGLTGDDLSFHTVSGEVALEDLRARSLTLRSVSGHLGFRGDVDRVSVNTVSGAIVMEGTAGTIEARTVSGRVDLAYSRTPDASFDLRSMSGSVEHQVAGAWDVEEARGRYGPQRRLRFSSGEATGSVALRSVSGALRVRAP